MTPAKSVAASVAALGFASTLTAPIPALANPTPCQRIEHFAAQSGAEVLRINRLDLGPLAGAAHKSDAPVHPGKRPGAADAARPSDAHVPPGKHLGAADAHRPSDAQVPPGKHLGAANAARPADVPMHPGKRLGAADAPRSAGKRLGATDAPRPAEDEVPGGGDSAVGAAGSNQRQSSAKAPSSSRAADALKAGASPATASAGGSSAGAAKAGAGPSSTDASAAGASNARGFAGARPGEASGANSAPAAESPAQKPKLVRPDKRAPQSIGGVGLGDARSVLIADGPVNSAAAARILDGRVAGPSARNDLVVQQAPPSNEKPTVRRTGERRFGPLRAGAGELTAHARWNADMTCASTDAQVSGSSTEISRITVTGAGSDSLLRVPEKISGLSDTAVRQRDGRPESVAWATISASRISLADGAVRIRVLRAPELRVSMSPTGKGEVQYRPAAVEISDRDGRTKRLSTPSDSIDITLREKARALESLPALIKPIAPLPLPPVAGLPSPGEPEATPAPANTGGTRLRISLGDVRQAAKGNAIAARATAIKVSLVRGEGSGRTKPGYGPSSVIADLGIGLLEGAAVAPAPVAHGQGVSSAGVGAGTGQLPITGPGAISLLLAGAALLASGAAAVFMGSRRRRSNS